MSSLRDCCVIIRDTRETCLLIGFLCVLVLIYWRKELKNTTVPSFTHWNKACVEWDCEDDNHIFAWKPVRITSEVFLNTYRVCTHSNREMKKLSILEIGHISRTILTWKLMSNSKYIFHETVMWWSLETRFDPGSWIEFSVKWGKNKQ
jgi:hypothetical protein